MDPSFWWIYQPKNKQKFGLFARLAHDFGPMHPKKKTFKIYSLTQKKNTRNKPRMKGVDMVDYGN